MATTIVKCYVKAHSYTLPLHSALHGETTTETVVGNSLTADSRVPCRTIVQMK